MVTGVPHRRSAATPRAGPPARHPLSAPKSPRALLLLHKVVVRHVRISKDRNPSHDRRPRARGSGVPRGTDHGHGDECRRAAQLLSLIHISEPTRLGMISYAVFCLKKKKQNKQST